MQVLKVNGYYGINTNSVSGRTNTNTSAIKTRKYQTDTVSFGNSEALRLLVKKATNTEIKDITQAATHFDAIIKAIKDSDVIPKSEDFNFIAETYQKLGFKKLFEEFWAPTPGSKVSEFVQKINEEDLLIAGSKDNQYVKIFNWSNYLFGNSNRIALTFQAADSEAIEFGLTKKGRIRIFQYAPDFFNVLDFYKDTGTLRKKIYNSAYTFQDTEYYNKDGSVAFWKNLILGGSPLPY